MKFITSIFICISILMSGCYPSEVVKVEDVNTISKDANIFKVEKIDGKVIRCSIGRIDSTVPSHSVITMSMKDGTTKILSLDSIRVIHTEEYSLTDTMIFTTISMGIIGAIVYTFILMATPHGEG
jgi:hypothetical protein